ncbi:hypothetical protein FT663_01592 [Candidozyma haemuli var. vulneris]|uniref:Uncharacterized protein n=1 Tax=Candidozyma haemuli TaxID=45357 RepID=A0A2V1AXH5_9ASCO|nr:hypothetical protein CXQ85_005063 [[Candida] haemuloni]KAF3986499.1 hypothetical protein FT662_04532 [[Candida] haemuloni var. vulneris]KAF3994092.1 hypothetical protein FT663_01592 [[Candida] haemuloni var. vulneris]PVH22494.1 hypothetical protein CXQ85_005063 [[Candida] haemuloni]
MADDGIVDDYVWAVDRLENILVQRCYQPDSARKLSRLLKDDPSPGNRAEIIREIDLVLLRLHEKSINDSKALSTFRSNIDATYESNSPSKNEILDILELLTYVANIRNPTLTPPARNRQPDDPPDIGTRLNGDLRVVKYLYSQDKEKLKSVLLGARIETVIVDHLLLKMDQMIASSGTSGGIPFIYVLSSVRHRLGQIPSLNSFRGRVQTSNSLSKLAVCSKKLELVRYQRFNSAIQQIQELLDPERFLQVTLEVQNQTHYIWQTLTRKVGFNGDANSLGGLITAAAMDYSNAEHEMFIEAVNRLYDDIHTSSTTKEFDKEFTIALARFSGSIAGMTNIPGHRDLVQATNNSLTRLLIKQEKEVVWLKYVRLSEDGIYLAATICWWYCGCKTKDLDYACWFQFFIGSFAVSVLYSVSLTETIAYVKRRSSQYWHPERFYRSALDEVIPPDFDEEREALNGALNLTGLVEITMKILKKWSVPDKLVEAHRMNLAQFNFQATPLQREVMQMHIDQFCRGAIDCRNRAFLLNQIVIFNDQLDSPERPEFVRESLTVKASSDAMILSLPRKQHIRSRKGRLFFSNPNFLVMAVMILALFIVIPVFFTLIDPASASKSTVDTHNSTQTSITDVIGQTSITDITGQTNSTGIVNQTNSTSDQGIAFKEKLSIMLMGASAGRTAKRLINLPCFQAGLGKLLRLTDS